MVSIPKKCDYVVSEVGVGAKDRFEQGDTDGAIAGSCQLPKRPGHPEFHSEFVVTEVRRLLSFNDLGKQGLVFCLRCGRHSYNISQSTGHCQSYLATIKAT